MLNCVKELKGYKLKCTDGDIGGVVEFYFDDRFWVVRYLVAQTGSWLTKKQVLISPYAMKEVTREDESIFVNLTKKQLEECPSTDADKPVSKQFEEAYYQFFGWPVYWGGPFMWGDYAFIQNGRKKAAAAVKTEKAWDPHLRSTKYVTGYRIHAEDGEIGTVEDFIIDDESWAIRYIIVNTGEWLTGKKVLISPRWIERVSFDEKKVYLGLTMENIKQAPEYTPETMPDRDYEERLHLHYKRQGYWGDESEVHEG